MRTDELRALPVGSLLITVSRDFFCVEKPSFPREGVPLLFLGFSSSIFFTALCSGGLLTFGWFDQETGGISHSNGAAPVPFESLSENISWKVKENLWFTNPSFFVKVLA